MQSLAPDDPARIGPYRLLSRLGAGGMGRVYLAWRTDEDGEEDDGGGSPTATVVAVKLVRTDPDVDHDAFRSRFTREVAAARRVSGKWTARVLDADTDSEHPWVATEYVPGPTLRAVVRGDFGPLPSASTHVLAHRLAQALDAIHTAGLVHRDLKPSNILLTADGPRVIDFGIARAFDGTADTTLTRTGHLIGTPEFMSPEQVRGERVTPAGDVFALGSVLTYAATGRSPFRGTGEGGVHALLFRIAYEEPDLTGVPEVITDLVRRCLAKDPDDRPDVAELVELTRRAPAGAWLPTSLLVRLDRVAAEPLPKAPQRAETPGEEPAEIPEFPDVPDALAPLKPILRRDPLDVPERGIAPPRIRRRPLSRVGLIGQQFLGATLAVVALVSVAVGGKTVWDAFEDDVRRATEEKETHARYVRVFAYKGLISLNQQHLGQQPFSLQLSVHDSTEAHYIAGTPEAVCKGTFGEVTTRRNRFDLEKPSRSVILPKGAPEAACPKVGRLQISLEDGRILWVQKSDRDRMLLGAVLTVSNLLGAPLPSDFVGTRTIHGWKVQVRSGPIGAPLVTGTREKSGLRCTWQAVVLDANTALRTTPPVLDEARSDPGCVAPESPVVWDG